MPVMRACTQLLALLLSERLRSSRAPHIEHIDCVAIGKVLSTNMRNAVGIASNLSTLPIDACESIEILTCPRDCFLQPLRSQKVSPAS